MFVKGEHERQFAYEAHTACDRHGFVLGVEVTAGHIHNSVAWDKVYEQITERFPEAKFLAMDAGYKTPWIAKKILTTHIWQEYLDLVEELRKTPRGKEIYAMRQETIERVFADGKEKHGMRYTHHRGLARVTSWVRLKYAAMNLKKLAIWRWDTSHFPQLFNHILRFYAARPVFA